MCKDLIRGRWKGLYSVLTALLVILSGAARADGFTSLYSFPTGESGPNSPLLQASDGFLYGTAGGGSFGAGKIVRMPLGGGPVTTVYTFTGGADGGVLYAGLIQAMDGKLYGTTAFGGAFNKGTVFQLTTAGALTTLYSFADGADGRYPHSPLLQASNGNLYGRTSEGGVGESVPAGYAPLSGGTVFVIKPGSGGAFVPIGSGGVFQTLYSFTANNFDGASELPGLIEASDHNLYGVTPKGGIQNNDGRGGSYGTVFRMSLSGDTFATIYSFGSNNDFAAPNSLMQGSDGNLYGTTEVSAVGDGGSVFEMPLAGGSVSTLHAFHYPEGPDGVLPRGLVQAADGNLYGTSDNTVFKMPLGGGSFTTLYTFSGGADGNGCHAAPTLAADGNLYGATLIGGASGDGTLWEYSLLTYSWSGYLQPINADGSSIFHLGRTIPVKFQLTGASAGITNVVARLYIAKVSNNVTGTYMEASSTSAADTGNQFRYSGGQYIFNLGTSGLSTGTYMLKVDLGDGVQNRTVLISLQ